MSPDCNCNPYSGCKVPRGTIDMHSCLDIFVLGSFPHFYLADEGVRNALEGMNPKKELHKTGIYFDLVRKYLKKKLHEFSRNFDNFVAHRHTNIIIRTISSEFSCKADT